MKHSRKRRAALSMVATAIGLTISIASPAGGAVDQRYADPRTQTGGTVMLDGSEWLGGAGVDVMSNGSSARNDFGDNVATTPSGLEIATGEMWQCVELVNRLYVEQGWIAARWTGNGGDMYGTAPEDLEKSLQGDVSSLALGDVLVWQDEDAGHVGIVSSVSLSADGTYLVKSINQNTSGSTEFTHTWNPSTGTIVGGFSSLTLHGVVHAPGAPVKYSLADEPSKRAERDDVVSAGNGWWVRYNGNSVWTPLRPNTAIERAPLGVGDFNNDGVDDIFFAGGTGVGWWYWPGGTGSAVQLSGSSALMHDLLIGDFDADGFQDDVLFAGGAGVGWKVRYNGNSAWIALRPNSTITRPSMAVGDFNNDGVDDILVASGAGVGWRYWPGGTGSAVQLSGSSALMHDLLIGDFDADGFQDDVLFAGGAGVGWKVRYNGNSAWIALRPNSTITRPSMAVGDFNNDGVDDILVASGAGVGWRYWPGGTGSAVQLSGSSALMHDLLIGDFDGE